ncbi:hypothetical protein ACTFIW_007771 [Dictyostelium discoideum]
MSSTQQVNVLAIASCKPEFTQEFIEFFKTIVKESRKEQGMIKYDLNQDSVNPNVFYVCEEYKSMADFEFHKTTPHFLSMVKYVEGKVESLEIKLLKPIE